MSRLFEFLLLATLAVLGQVSWPLAKADEVIGCGGFIKSNTEINYKIIKVKLLTKERIVKYTTEASPVNGYYMIPIYNKGEYILQVNPPPGWSFEPNEVNVNINGETDPCTKNEDINFFFKGFGLSGRIVTQGDAKNDGPSGIKLNLIAADKVIDTTTSGADGSYYFSNVMPGSYQVEAQHPSITFKTNKVNVVLSKENWSARENIVVSGYKIEGVVTALDKSPIANALVQLHFSDKQSANIETKGFQCDHSVASKDNLRVCQAKTDANGKFSFANVAFAKYRLTTVITTKDGLVFDTKPNELTADLTKHQNVQLSQPFLLNSVTVASKAFVSENKPLEDGQVSLNGQKVSSRVAKDGSFKLSQLVSGTYRVNIESASVYFEEKSLKIDLSTAGATQPDNSKYQQILSLTKFIANGFDVCGQVKIIAKDANLYKSITVKCFLVGKSEKQLALVKSATLDQNFKYCFNLNSKQEYIVQAELNDNLAGIMKLVPIERRVNLVDSPLFDVNFEQMEAKLEGRVVFLANTVPPADLKLTISSTDSRRAWSKDLSVTCPSADQIKASAGKPIACTFTLTNLYFESYKVSSNYDNLFCWKSSGNGGDNLLTINAEKNEFVIEQAGYKLEYELSHQGGVLRVADFDQKDKSKFLFERPIATDSDLSGSVCLAKLARYNLAIASCHKYTNSNKNEDVIVVEPEIFRPNKNKLTLTAIKHETRVEVVFKVQDATTSEKKRLGAQDVSVDVYDKPAGAADRAPIEKLQFALKTESSAEMVFAAHGWFAADQDLYLEAKSSKLLFEGNAKSLRVSGQNCAQNLVRFEAKLGIFISVRINPAADIDGIELILKNKQSGEVIFKTSLNGAQPNKLGPLKAPFSLYQVELSKPSFLFNRVATDKEANVEKDVYQVEFKVEQLGQLKVSVVDKKNKAVNLENVLLSLSSEDRVFRERIKTGANGVASFDNLKPGLYYLIVIMQEYEFVPNSHPVQISDGSHMTLVVEANRVAYSCMGKAASINGQAESELLVEAKGIRSVSGSGEGENDLCKSSQENAKTNENEFGSYRISNLKPNCEYEITARYLTTDSGQGIIPRVYNLVVAEADITEKNFIVIPRLESVDLSVAVKVDYSNNLQYSYSTTSKQQTVNFVRLRLFKTMQPDSIIQTEYVPANSIAYFSPLVKEPGQRYSVQVELLAPMTIAQSAFSRQLQHLHQQPAIEKTEVSFFADHLSKHVVARFDLDKKKSAAYDQMGFNQQQYQNIYFTLPIFIVAIGILLNTTKAQEALGLLGQAVQQVGGLTAFLSSLFAPRNAGASSSPQATPAQSSSNKHKSQQKPDHERSKSSSSSRPQPQPANTSAAPQAANDDVEIVDDTDNFEMINDYEIQALAKKKVKKIY